MSQGVHLYAQTREASGRRDKWKVLSIIGVGVLIIGLLWIAFGFSEMNRYRKYSLAMAYDLENPEVTTKVEIDGQTVRLSDANRRALSFYMFAEDHARRFGKPETVGELREVKCYRQDGKVSVLELAETEDARVYVGYECEQGSWKYYLAGIDYRQIEKILSPEGKIDENTVLVH